MKVEEIMSDGVQVIGPYTSIQDAARLMARQNVGMLPVVDHRGCLLGVVTDRDITVRSLANGLWPHSTIDRIMTMNPEWVPGTTDLEEALERMECAQIGRLVVCDDVGHVVGVLSLGDVLAKANVPHLIVKVSRALGRRSTTVYRNPGQFAHIG